MRSIDLKQILNKYRKMLGVPKHIRASDFAAVNYYIKEIAAGTVIVDLDNNSAGLV